MPVWSLSGSFSKSKLPWEATTQSLKVDWTVRSFDLACGACLHIIQVWSLTTLPFDAYLLRLGNTDRESSKKYREKSVKLHF